MQLGFHSIPERKCIWNNKDSCIIINKIGVNDKPGLSFVGTSSYTNFRTLVRVLLYGDVVHVSSCSIVHVHWHERVATVGNFYMKDANARLN
jgi:hypothetical protein